jgi:hypothetical protein
MTRNVGTADKAIRITLAVVLAVLYFNNTVTGTWGIVALVVAGVLLLTSLINFCPIWALFGLSTRGSEKK